LDKHLSHVFVVDTNKQPLNPVHPAQARKLLSCGKAAVYRRYPFTIILKVEIVNPVVADLRIKLDPGSKTTGIAIVITGVQPLRIRANGHGCRQMCRMNKYGFPRTGRSKVRQRFSDGRYHSGYRHIWQKSGNICGTSCSAHKRIIQHHSKTRANNRY
jgi:hypothetical protein